MPQSSGLVLCQVIYNVRVDCILSLVVKFTLAERATEVTRANTFWSTVSSHDAHAVVLTR